MKVLILGGGPSDEHEISMRSARNVFDSLTDTDHNVELFEWDGTYDWLDHNISNFDVALPILHGKGGEDGEIQKYLEDKSTPYLGSSQNVSKLCFDKESTKDKVRELGFLVPDGGLMTFEEYANNILRHKPHVIKPVSGGSSIHTHIFKTPAVEIPEAVIESFKIFKTLLVEEFIEGQEITVGVLGDRALPVVEIIPPEGQLFDYENKYNGATKELCPPKNISLNFQKQAQEIALAVHHDLGCSHISRTDIIVSNGKLYFLEINTIPGLTSQSLFPKAARESGNGFPELAEEFIDMALRDYN